MRSMVLEGLAGSVTKRADLRPRRGSPPRVSPPSRAPLLQSDTDLSAGGAGHGVSDVWQRPGLPMRHRDGAGQTPAASGGNGNGPGGRAGALARSGRRAAAAVLVAFAALQALPLQAQVQETPTVTIAADKTIAVFKEDGITYTLTRTGSTTNALPVTVRLMPAEDFLAATELTDKTVTIGAGQSTATLTVAASSFQHFAEGTKVVGGPLTAAVQDGSAYDLGTTASVEVDIVIGVIIQFEMASYSWGEADGNVEIKVIARTGRGAGQPTSPVPYVMLPGGGSATNSVDFFFVKSHPAFLVSNFSESGGVWQAEGNYVISITNDEVDEDDETFDVQIERVPSETYSLVDASDNSCGSVCTVTVTIVDDDASKQDPAGNSTDATLSALTLKDNNTDEIALSPTFASGTHTYTASVANGVDKITIVPVVNDSTAKYEILDGSGAALTDANSTENDFQVSLAEGENTIKVEVVAEDDSTILTYTVVVTRTINNTDHMPKAWMVRFGRTVGSHVVDALGQRLEGGTASHVTVGGISLTEAPGAVPEAQSDDPFGLPEWAKRTQREESAQSPSANDLLLGSAFHLSSQRGQGGGAAYTAWGRVATSEFEAEVDDVTMDGDVTTGLVGFDAEWERVLAGVMLSQSKGEGDYRLKSGKAASVESSLTGVYPYARLALNARMSAWALAGAGSGELTLKQEGDKSIPTDITMRMGAVGFKGQVLDGTSASGLAMNLKSDAMWVGTKSDRTSDMVATEGDVTRLRLTLEGERPFAVGDGATFTPSAEVGLRHDRGDAKTGTGFEVGAGLRYVAGPLTVEGQVRTLVAHEESGYEEWGASGAVRITPGPSGQGLMLRFAPEWGRTASATERLWSTLGATALGADSEFEGDSRLAVDAGYGVGLAHGRGVLTPYAGLTLGDAGSRTVHTGARWQVSPDAVLALEATRQTSNAGETDNQMLRLALRF